MKASTRKGPNKMRNRTWLWISAGNTTARVELENNIIVAAAPVFKWSLGMTKKEFFEALRNKHRFVYKEFKNEPS